MSYSEAVQKLEDGILAEGIAIDFASASAIKVHHALGFRKLGYPIPDDLIKYPDEIGEQVEDDDFEGDWTPIESDIEDHRKHLTISLDVDKEVEDWLNSADVDVDSLVSELVSGFYRSVKLVQEKS